MNVTLTLETVINGKLSFDQFANRTDIPLLESYKFAKIYNQIKEEYEIIDEQKRKLLIKHGVTKDNSDNLELANEEWKTFITTKTITLKYEPMKIKDLKDKDGNYINITPSSLSFLLPFIKD